MKKPALYVCNYAHKEDCVEDCHHRFPHEKICHCSDKCDVSSLVKCVRFYTDEEIAKKEEVLARKIERENVPLAFACLICGNTIEELEEIENGYCNKCMRIMEEENDSRA